MDIVFTAAAIELLASFFFSIFLCQSGIECELQREDPFTPLSMASVAARTSSSAGRARDSWRRRRGSGLFFPTLSLREASKSAFPGSPSPRRGDTRREPSRPPLRQARPRWQRPFKPGHCFGVSALHGASRLCRGPQKSGPDASAPRNRSHSCAGKLAGGGIPGTPSPERPGPREPKLSSRAARVLCPARALPSWDRPPYRDHSES